MPSFRINNATTNLVELHGLKQRLEITFAEPLVTATFDKFNKDRSQHTLGKNLQQQALALGGRTIDQDAVFLEGPQIDTMARKPTINQFRIGVPHPVPGHKFVMRRV